MIFDFSQPLGVGNWIEKMSKPLFNRIYKFCIQLWDSWYPSKVEKGT